MLILLLMVCGLTETVQARPVGTVKVGLISSPSFYVRYLVLEPLMVKRGPNPAGVGRILAMG